MSNSSSRPIERALIGLVIATVCLRAVADILPHVVVPLAVLAAVFVLVRLVLFHTRQW